MPNKNTNLHVLHQIEQVIENSSDLIGVSKTQQLNFSKAIKDVETMYSLLEQSVSELEYLHGKEIYLTKTIRNLITDGHKKQIVVTLCGSMRFIDQFVELYKSLTDKGYVVFAPDGIVCRGDEENLTTSDFDLLRHMHEQKINISDYIIVVDPDGYIGESTSHEIEYAKSKGVDILFMSDKIDL